MSGGKKDALNQTVSFLSKRDGLDKVLKLGKYLSGLGIELNKNALQGVAQGGGGVDWSKLESALSLSRKAFRLGKFLNNVKKCRAILAETETDAKKKKSEEEEEESSASEDERRRRSALLALSLLFNFTEGVYYFLDQFQFLVKAKVVSKKSKAVGEVKRWATYFEILAYLSDSACQCLLIKEQQQKTINNNKQRLLSSGGGSGGGEKEEKQREEEAERQIFESKVVLVQNAADFIMALNDVRQVDHHLGNPSFLALLGVLSAGIGIRSKWQ